MSCECSLTLGPLDFIPAFLCPTLSTIPALVSLPPLLRILKEAGLRFIQTKPFRYTAFAVLWCAVAVARGFGQYVDYPQTVGKTQQFSVARLPNGTRLDIEVRGRTEAQTAINSVSGNARVYELTRVRGAISIKPTSWISAYIQFQDAHALGLPLKFTASNMRDTFDLRQARLKIGSNKVSLIAGRQQLRFGDERLIGISDWTNVSRTFDGFDLRIGHKNRVDIFTQSVVDITPTAFDEHGAGLNLHGLYGTLKQLVPKTTLEPYLFVKALPRVKSQQSIYGDETEVTYGMRVSRDAHDNFDYVVEGILQRGSYSNNSIHAGAAYAKLRRTFMHAPWVPAIQGEYDYATGNPHRNPERVSTFDQLYPSDHNVFGLVDLFGWQNIKQVRVNLYLTPGRNLTVLVQQEFLNLASTKDAVYGGNGKVFMAPPPGGFISNDIGRGFDASLKYIYHDYWVLNAGVGHFSPGQALRPNGPPLTISYISLTYRFSMSKHPLNDFPAE